MGLSRERKQEYFEKMENLLDNYSKVFIVSCDNVGSKQFQQIRMALRGMAIVLMGKNTMMRKVINTYLAKNPGHPYEVLLSRVRGNIGFVFTNGDLSAVRESIEKNRVPAPARVGAIAPIDVVVPPGPTDCDPGQTNFFQTLQIATKIVKGKIEIVSPVNLLQTGDRVGNSEAVLLEKLGIKPFDYGLIITEVYDNGSIFDVAVLDLSEDDLAVKFANSLSSLAAFSLGAFYPTLISVPHSIANAYKALVAVAVECETFSFEKADPFKLALSDPEAFAAKYGSTGGGGGGAGGGADAAAPVEEEAKEEEEEEEVDMCVRLCLLECLRERSIDAGGVAWICSATATVMVTTTKHVNLSRKDSYAYCIRTRPLCYLIATKCGDSRFAEAGRRGNVMNEFYRILHVSSNRFVSVWAALQSPLWCALR